MMTSTENIAQTGAEKAARVALKSAHKECRAAGINPEEHGTELTEFVVSEVKKALDEMLHDKKHGGPTAALMLTSPFYQNIYFADAGRQAAHGLIAKLGQRQAPEAPTSPAEAKTRAGEQVIH